MKRKIFSIIILALHLLITYPSISQEVLIAVASNFKPAIEKLLEEFGDENITIVVDLVENFMLKLLMELLTIYLFQQIN